MPSHLKPGDVISYMEMCSEEEVNLQRGMNFRLKGTYSVILMSQRRNAPYADSVEENGKVLIYEGHDVPNRGDIDPKSLNQTRINPSGSLNQNGLFHKAAEDYKKNSATPERVKVYEKIYPGIWVFNGYFNLVDAWKEKSGNREVFKFRLVISDDQPNTKSLPIDLEQNRLIPSKVKLEVWKRDGGACVRCGKKDNLHFDHIIPYSKGGTSLTAKNIQLLCARHNLEKLDKIQ